MKRLLCLLLVCVTLKAVSSPPTACDLALDACQGLVTAEDTQIAHLKSNEKLLEDKLEAEASPLVPWWGWTLAGVVVGGFVVMGVRR